MIKVIMMWGKKQETKCIMIKIVLNFSLFILQEFMINKQIVI